MTKKFGFTLAEVLITLGIIGVVAAMTMPTLMNQTNGLQYKTAYKKALSAISQAVVLNVALDEWNLADATDTDAKTKDDNGNNVLSIWAMLNNRMNVNSSIAARDYDIKGGEVTEDNTSGAIGTNANNYSLFFNDGIMFEFPKAAKECTLDSTRNGSREALVTNKCIGFIDVNGKSNPNRVVSCEGDSDPCQVTKPTDVYPVIFFDQTILPNSDAARAVLYAK